MVNLQSSRGGQFSTVIDKNSDLLVDADGQVFINYLESVLIAPDDAGPFYDEFEAHRDQVVRRLNEFRRQPAIWSKYAWVARYHNYFCAQNSRYFSSSHSIDPALFSAEPSRLVPR